MLEDIILHPVGMIRSSLLEKGNAPKNHTESTETGVLEIRPEFRDAMLGLKKGQTVVALFWLDRAHRQVLRVHPRGDHGRPLQGVFNTRSPDRPNPIAVSELTIEEIHETSITVRGVDILDNTPVLDLKKKISR